MAGITPDRIERLALLDTNHLADAPGRFEIRNRQINDVRVGRLREVIVDEMKPVYLAKANRSNQPLLDLLVAMAMDCGANAFVAQSIALRDRDDQSATLAACKQPALVLCGAEDELCPLDRHREMAGLLENSELVIVPGAGHISTLENPAAVTAAVEEWLARPAS
ncbi:MAG: alpha/beta hydrolase [Nitratireductor sp.]